MISTTTRRWVALAAFAVLPFALIGSFIDVPWPTWGRAVRSSSSNGLAGSDIPAPPAPEPQLVKPLTAEEALAANDELPFVKNGIERASSFGMGDLLADPIAYKAALDCLTAAVYYEAAGEGDQGQRAVAQVVLNRVRHPAFPATVCDVVYQGSERQTGCQFTFTCDGSLSRRPSRAGWDRARKIATDALAGSVDPSVGMATHYHANFVVPYWAPNLDKIAAIGAHIFYRWPGYWGRRQAFTQRYTGETMPEAPNIDLGFASEPVGEDPLRGSQTNPVDLVGPLPMGLRPTVDESKRELVRDQPSGGGLIVDENQFKLARDAEPTPAP